MTQHEFTSLKFGDKVRVISTKTHNFKFGSIVTFSDYNLPSSLAQFTDKTGLNQYLSKEYIESVEQYPRFDKQLAACIENNHLDYDAIVELQELCAKVELPETLQTIDEWFKDVKETQERDELIRKDAEERSFNN